MKTKGELFKEGCALVRRFCKKNKLPVPKIAVVQSTEWRFDCCAYYRPRDGIVICVEACANIGTAYRAWSYPGYTVDRTPYGVLAHETGHHVDFLKGENKGTYWSELSSDMRGIANEDPLTGYCPNDAEWFAEMMRLFITNPNLLQALRPETYAALYARGLRPVFGDEWRARLAGAPARTLVAAERKVAKCARR